MKIPVEYLKRAQHPKLNSRLVLAEIIYLLLFLVFIIDIISNDAYYIIVIAIVLVLMGWFGFSIAKSRFKANAIKVSRNNFPGIYEVYCEVQTMLDYHKEVPIYIVEEGSVNASLLKFLGNRFIILNSGLVEDMGTENRVQMKWIIARFIGGLKVKHFRNDVSEFLVDQIEDLQVLNIFLLPYKRAVQYSGDNIGLLVCEGDIEKTLVVLNKLLVGNDLAKGVNLTGILLQGAEIKDDFFVILSRLTSTHPHLLSRHLNLLSFCRTAYPSQFQKIMERYYTPEIPNVQSLFANYR